MNSIQILMNRLLTVILLTLVAHSLSAQYVGRRAAQQRAAAVMGTEAQLELAVVAEGDSPAYYVFNNTASAKGFVIVAGEKGNNDILGYATSGQFDADNLPPQLAFWLACYEEQLELIRQSRAVPYRAATIYPTIEPLVTTHWDQQSPYNKMNPMNPVTDKQFPTTGCVATAMAQVMKYWSSDKPTTDIPEYSYKLNSSGTVYQVEVPGLSATTFDYALMRNNYSSGDNDDSAQEVARLMAYCGRAAKMIYTSTIAYTNMPGKCFPEYFSYNVNQVMETREYYSSQEWDSLLYHELQASRPVIYSGARQNTNKEQDAHAFIIDGYKDGLFHINWGWSGRYDGFFKLSECNPYGSGTGAGVGRDGFSFRQLAVTHLTPGEVEPTEPRGGESPEGGGLVVNDVKYEGVLRAGHEITMRVNITNEGVAYYNKAFLFVDDKLTTGAGVWIDPGETDDILLHFASETDGLLSLKLCGANDGSLMFWEGQLSVKKDKDPMLKFSEATVANVFDPVARTILGRFFEATFTVTNEDSESFEEPIHYILYKGSKLDYDVAGEVTEEKYLAAGETQEVTLSFGPLDVNSSYMLVARYQKYSDKATAEVPLTKYYKILGGQTEVKMVRCDGVATDDEELFDLQGRRVTQPRKGDIYLLRHQGITKKVAIP